MALWAERAETLGRKQLAGAEVEHFLALTPVERRILQSDGDSHVRTNLEVGVCAVYVVVQVAEVIEECLDKRLLASVGQSRDAVEILTLLSGLLQ